MPTLAPSFIQAIKELIANGKMDKALKDLLDELDKHPKLILAYEEVLVLSGHYKIQQAKQRQGIVQEDPTSSTAYKLLEVLNQIDSRHQGQHNSRIDELLAKLRISMFSANTSKNAREIKRLTVTIKSFRARYPDNFELVELEQQVQKSLDSYKRSSSGQIGLILGLLIVVGTIGMYFNDYFKRDSQPELAALITTSGITLEGTEGRLEEPECQKLIALTNDMNAEKTYLTSLYKATDLNKPIEPNRVRIKGEYAQLYDSLQLERGRVLSTTLEMETALIDSIQSKYLFFENDNKVISKADQKTLDRLMVLLQKHPNWGVQLDGLTNKRNNREKQIEMATEQTTFVQDYLLSNGITSGQITIDRKTLPDTLLLQTSKSPRIDVSVLRPSPN